MSQPATFWFLRVIYSIRMAYHSVVLVQGASPNMLISHGASQGIMLGFVFIYLHGF